MIPYLLLLSCERAVLKENSNSKRYKIAAEQFYLQENNAKKDLWDRPKNFRNKKFRNKL